ncbi:thermonuclease family protein, partial [Arthrobacter sp. H41]|uniref:thermonuclease family protein n=1 Tax=Arthrobacter sp. H41 TaxID=1312978 RepID=UPI00138AF699
MSRHKVLRRIALFLTAALAAPLAGCAEAPDGEVGTVVRVIDGDTLVINFDGEDQRVRLLNVDTPETKHPDKPVECLGPEASTFLENLTPAGTKVGLDFDVERTDQYDRVLAAVFLEDRTLVNAEVARNGLGAPVVVEPNREYFDEVQAAYTEASTQQIGLLDPAAECTLPVQATQAMADLAEAAEAAGAASSAGGTAAALAAAVGGVAVAIASAKALREAITAGRNTVLWTALGGAAAADALTKKLSSAISSGEASLASTQQIVADRELAEKAAAEAVAAEEQAQAAAVAVEAERVQREADLRAEAERVAANLAAAADAERDRIANLPPVPAPYVPPAPAPYIPPAPA